jgi:hypothetical protein
VFQLITEFFDEIRQKEFFLFFHFFLNENASGCFESADESVNNNILRGDLAHG